MEYRLNSINICGPVAYQLPGVDCNNVHMINYDLESFWKTLSPAQPEWSTDGTLHGQYIQSVYQSDNMKAVRDNLRT